MCIVSHSRQEQYIPTVRFSVGILEYSSSHQILKYELRINIIMGRKRKRHTEFQVNGGDDDSNSSYCAGEKRVIMAMSVVLLSLPMIF